VGRLPGVRGSTPGHRWSRSVPVRQADWVCHLVAEVAAEEPSGADKRVRLPMLGRYRGTVEYHAEGTTELAVAVAEDS
jgi:hypothetical protein